MTVFPDRAEGGRTSRGRIPRGASKGAGRCGNGSRPSLPLALCLLLAAGCARDHEAERRAHAEAFAGPRLARTRELIAGRAPLDLADCLELALAESLELRRAAIERRLATVDRQAGFGAFLPSISIEYNWHDDHYAPAMRMETAEGVQVQQMADEYFGAGALRVEQPLFVPQAYVAYQMLRRGEDIAELVERRTRQQIVLMVVSRYYAVLAREEARVALEGDCAYVDRLRGQLAALHRERWALASERERAELMAAGAHQALDAAGRALVQARGELLAAMGLHPQADCELAPSPPLPMPAGELPDLILHALLHRPELGIADRSIAVSEDEALMALVSWLPNIVGFGRVDYTGNSMMRWGWNYTYGIGAVLTVLDGLRSVNDYRRARIEQRGARIEREQQALAIALGVQGAYRQHVDAAVAHAVAARAAEAVERRFIEVEARRRAGMVDPAASLAARADLVRARSAVTAARYREEMTAAALIDAVGGDLERRLLPDAPDTEDR